MEYQWNSDPSKHPGQSVQSWKIEILTMEEFGKNYARIAEQNFANLMLSQIRYCKADQLNKGVAGAFAIPPREDPSLQKQTFGYYLTEDRLILVDDSSYVKHLLDAMKKNQIAEITSSAILLFEMMQYLLKEDMETLLQYEEQLTDLEEQLTTGSSEGFEEKILAARKDLSALSSYYEQLSDVGEILEQNMAENGREKESRLFEMYAAKAGRFFSTVQMLKEYTLQLREMHQTSVGVRQNEIMQFLTVVTTIFMPLTLIAGWYGMNFAHMPELQIKNGYRIICIVCAVIVLIEILVFWKKKWFK